MTFRICSILLVVAFLNYIISCSHLEQSSTDRAIRGREKIDQLVLKNGLTVQFDQVGGKFLSMSRGLQGVTSDGVPIFVSLDRVVEFRTDSARSISEAELEGATIAEIVLVNKELISFDKAGARYDKGRHIMTGRQENGAMFSDPIDRILSIRTTKPKALTAEEFLLIPDGVVREAVIDRNTLVVFDPSGAHYKTATSVFAGKNPQRELVEVPADEVLYANVTKTDVFLSILATVGVIVGVLGVAFLIVLATKQSCPFVYSFDGKHYVLDAEPLGGAICRGLVRTDYSRLDHLAEVDGKYQLLIRNEVPETQYLDELRLAVVDHAVNTMIVPDRGNTLRCIAPPISPVAAVDEHGTGLMRFLVARDGVAWQTHLPTACAIDSGSLRHHLTITFPKPRGATSATLVVKAGTALWGSNMIRKMLEYRGDEVDDWLAKLSPNSTEYRALYAFVEREELYYLKVHVREGDVFVPRAVIRGGGPLITQDQAVALDLRNVQGDSLVIQLHPPMGYWQIDYVGIDYGGYGTMTMTELPVLTAVDHKGVDISTRVQVSDQQYYMMPEVGDWAKVSFVAPPQSAGTVRSLFLKTTGYYELHLAKKTPAQHELLEKIVKTPGYIVHVAMQEFMRWRADQREAYGETK